MPPPPALAGLYSLLGQVTGGGFAHRVPSTDLKVGLRYQSWGDFYLMTHQRWSRGGGICGQLGQASTFGDDVPVF